MKLEDTIKELEEQLDNAKTMLQQNCEENVLLKVFKCMHQLTNQRNNFSDTIEAEPE